MPWERKRYKNGKIFVEVDDQNRILVQNGLVTTKYRKDDPRTYSMRADAIRDFDGSVPASVVRDQGTAPPVTDTSAFEAQPPSGQATPLKHLGPLKVSNLNNTSPLSDLPPAGTDFVEIYTDGACTGNPGPAGLGVLLRWGTYHRELYQYIGRSTNNVAELMAIKVALEAVKDPRRPIKVYTDSSYALGVLTGRYKAKANRALIITIQKIMTRFKDLEILKVAGHSGHPLNDRVDELARQAITEQQAP